MEDPVIETAQALQAEFIVGGLVFIICTGLVTWLLLKAADKAVGTMLTLALSLLTVVAMVGFIITREEVLATLAATGIGALAGAVTYQLGGAAADDRNKMLNEIKRQQEDQE